MGSRTRNAVPAGRSHVRCAIYTRKSSEEGLEQDFNSLDAQREACEAFVRSQKHEGWVVVPAAYDDGGISGATLDRRALTRLLADIEAQKIDTVVVYKVDRLTRSLNDFAKIVEIFDKHAVSFVSVTQQFNTTTSMGRLTLNMLLSFAQFEREVTGERIRDKIAASKKKGLWMGGLPPLGYDVKDRALVLNEPEVQTVRHIFGRYAALGSIRRLEETLDREGVVTKRRVNRHGRRSGGTSFTRGALYRLLQNRIYRGEIVHKGRSYPGQHQSIIDEALWQSVQSRLAANRVERRSGRRAGHPSLLAGLLHDEAGDGMTPSHAVKNGTQYHYYVSRRLVTGDGRDRAGALRLPAAEIEGLVERRLLALLRDRTALYELLRLDSMDTRETAKVLDQANALAEQWPGMCVADRKALLHTVLTRIDLRPETIDIHLCPDRLVDVLSGNRLEAPQEVSTAGSSRSVVLKTAAQLKRIGVERKLLIEDDQDHRPPDPSLVRLLAQAHRYQMLLCEGGRSLADMAAAAGVTRSYFTRILRLSFIAPEITEAVLNGRQPRDLTAAKLTADTRLPLAWTEQRTQLGV